MDWRCGGQWRSSTRARAVGVTGELVGVTEEASRREPPGSAQRRLSFVYEAVEKRGVLERDEERV